MEKPNWISIDVRKIAVRKCVGTKGHFFGNYLSFIWFNASNRYNFAYEYILEEGLMSNGRLKAIKLRFWLYFCK